MNRFWRATPVRWAISIALLVWFIVYVAALVGPIAGVSIIPNTYRGSIKSISENVFFTLFIVSAVVECVRGRPPWAPFREAYRRKKRAGPAAKP